MVSKLEYNSLQDDHLAHHFRKPVVFRHLLCMGLVTPEGKVLSEREWKNSQRFPSQDEQKTPRLRSLASEGNLRPSQSKRKGVAGEPYLDSLIPFRNSNYCKIYSIRSAGGTQISKCSQVWERLCPPPNYNISISSWRRTPPTPAYFKLRYLGKTDPIKLLILQQPSGINSVTVFSGTVHSREEFSFTSCRARDASFSLVVYENDLCTCRVNTCCERRYYPGRKIGGPSGHFLVTEVKGGSPCSRCESATPVHSMTAYSNSHLRKAVGTKITIDVQLVESDSGKSSSHNKEGRMHKYMELGNLKEELDFNADSQHSSISDLRSEDNEDEERDNQNSQASENDVKVNYDSNDTQSVSEADDISESASDANKNSISKSQSEYSQDANDSKCEEENNQTDNGGTSDDDDDDLSKKSNDKNDDYSSDFTSSHSTIKEHII